MSETTFLLWGNEGRGAPNPPLLLTADIAGEQSNFSLNLISLVSCRQISDDCDRVHGERLPGFLSPGKMLFRIHNA